MLDHEDVVAGALGQLALVVEHQGLEAAGLRRLVAGREERGAGLGLQPAPPRVRRRRGLVHQ